MTFLNRLTNTQIICIIRGTFVEEVGDLIDPTAEEKMPPPFVHLRYVQMDEPYSSGIESNMFRSMLLS